MFRTVGMVAALFLAGCESHETRANQALREAEVACGFPKGMLEYLGGSEDPLRKDASNKPPFTVITSGAGPKGTTSYDCLDRFRSSRGVRIQQLRTD